MKISRKRFGTLMALIGAVLSLMVVMAPTPALADRCEPTELVVRAVLPGYEEPVATQDSPVCYTLINYVYPRVCDDYSTLMNCTASINPDPLNEPVSVSPYQPEPGRIYCNVRTFAIGGSCTYDPIWP